MDIVVDCGSIAWQGELPQDAALTVIIKLTAHELTAMTRYGPSPRLTLDDVATFITDSVEAAIETAEPKAWPDK